MRRNTLILLLPLALGLLCSLGTMTQDVQTATVEPTLQKSDPVPGTAAEIQDYGRRESQNPGLSGFAGGRHHDDEVVVVGVSCGALLIAILVLVILL